ncbi:hypothetical protein DHEL01_v203260 [Diaporthe helianthi]|uniref:Uncharacterized protein n=1 Tax=Diaporthe helianthi TaxID=158607 RepID=A0A2P5I776_DIAHE|nr:hypothetical protein DHEL01_v203260 [Diaporthe helianthi]
MAIPLEYNPLTRVVLSDPDRLPHLPVQVLYLIAQALPQPSQVFNLARVNKATWEYLQPALYECEVTYEARLIAHFGHEYDERRSPTNADNTGRTGGDDQDHDNTKKNEQAECNRHCVHGLVTELCEGRVALPVARKAIEAAKAHNPSYIDGRGLRARDYERPNHRKFLGEIPPPLFTAIIFGNLTLCEVLVEAQCNVNLIQARAFFGAYRRLSFSHRPHFQIHDSCVPSGDKPWADPPDCQRYGGLDSPTCKTAGRVALDFGHADILGYLLDNGLNPLMGSVGRF